MCMLFILSVLSHFLRLVAQVFVSPIFVFKQVILLVIQFLVQAVFIVDGTALLFQEIGYGLKSDAKFFDCFIYSDTHAVCFWKIEDWYEKGKVWE